MLPFVTLAACRTLIRKPQIAQFLDAAGGAALTSRPSSCVNAMDFAQKHVVNLNPTDCQRQTSTEHRRYGLLGTLCRCRMGYSECPHFESHRPFNCQGRRAGFGRTRLFDPSRRGAVSKRYLPFGVCQKILHWRRRRITRNSCCQPKAGLYQMLMRQGENFYVALAKCFYTVSAGSGLSLAGGRAMRAGLRGLFGKELVQQIERQQGRTSKPGSGGGAGACGPESGMLENPRNRSAR